MNFRWTPPIDGEWSAGTPPPTWLYVVLFFLIECLFLGGTLATWPDGKEMVSEDFIRTAVAAPCVLWMAASFVLYGLTYDNPVFEAAVKNVARWHLLTQWQRECRTGMAVLDSVLLAPEPALAERMLKLEGETPENPGRVMRLDSIDGDDCASRECVLIERLMTPLALRLAKAKRSDSFDIVLQCARAESALHVKAIWKQLQLPGDPRIRWMSDDRNPGFAEHWFEDGNPEYRLVLAWHLHDPSQDIQPDTSEAAVALLLGWPALMGDTPVSKPQAWLLRQIVSDADEVDKALALLIGSEQVPRERIRQFWYSRLSGLAKHATLGAVRDSDLTVEVHALDSAVGPQAPVARWMLHALAAKMAQFGQGAQLVALPAARGVALNVVVKDAPRANVPWKADYEYNWFPSADLAGCMSLWTFLALMSPNKTWGAFDTVYTVVIAVVVILSFTWRLFWGPRIHTDYVWREFQ